METRRLHLKLFAGELSMSKHEEFEELCALAATGQLSAEEDELRLSEHLENCQPCRAVCEDFAMIFREIPASERGVVGPRCSAAD